MKSTLKVIFFSFKEGPYFSQETLARSFRVCRVCHQLIFLICWLLGRHFSVQLTHWTGEHFYHPGFSEHWVTGFFWLCGELLLFLLCAFSSKGEAYSLFYHSISLPSIFCSSDTATSKVLLFHHEMRHTIVLSPVISFSHFYVRKLTVGKFSAPAPRCPAHRPVIISRLSPAILSLGTLYCSQTTPLVLTVVPRGR